MTPTAPVVPRHAINIEDLRRRAQRRLPRFIFDYIDGGAEDEDTLRANRVVFDHWRFLPRVMRDVSQRNLSCSLLGTRAALPAVIGPTGLAGLFWRDGDIALARTARTVGIPFVLSTASMASIESVAGEGGRVWFQAYVFRNRAVTEALIRRAQAVGCEALVITCDFAVPGKRERDWRNGLVAPLRSGSTIALDILRHPRWVLSVLSRRPRFVNIEQELGSPRDTSAFVSTQIDPALSWDDLCRYRDLWHGKLVLKGVLRADDAERAVALGVDGVVVSNHGGRQLDGAVTALAALPAVVKAVGGRAAVFVDGGIRRGRDIAMAAALGAQGVLLGRAPLYGLAAAGQAGAQHALEILRDELDRTLALTGCATMSELGPELLMRVDNDGEVIGAC